LHVTAIDWPSPAASVPLDGEIVMLPGCPEIVFAAVTVAVQVTGPPIACKKGEPV
jgi:hypothetical protein